MTTIPLLQLKALGRDFGLGRKRFTAVQDFSLDIAAGEVIALVGESGSGKSTIGRMALALLPPTRGTVDYNDRDGRTHPLSTLTAAAVRPLRADLNIVQQDPLSALDARLRLVDSVAEPLRALKLARKADAKTRARSLLERLGLDGAEAEKFPHEVSGGQRQRVLLARALVTDPRFLVLDEPVSALDVSLKAQVVNLLRTERQARDLAMLIITHDLSIVPPLADTLVVLYAGTLVEKLSGGQFAARARHPYTRALFDAVPLPDPERERTRRKLALRGDATTPRAEGGCLFRHRCPLAEPRCAEEVPAQRMVEAQHEVACLLVD